MRFVARNSAVSSPIWTIDRSNDLHGPWRSFMRLTQVTWLSRTRSIVTRLDTSLNQPQNIQRNSQSRPVAGGAMLAETTCPSRYLRNFRENTNRLCDSARALQITGQASRKILRLFSHALVRPLRRRRRRARPRSASSAASWRARSSGLAPDGPETSQPTRRRSRLAPFSFEPPRLNRNETPETSVFFTRDSLSLSLSLEETLLF